MPSTKSVPSSGELVSFMTSAPIVLQVLEGENAVAAYREVMGATDPAQASGGTIRKKFAAVEGRELGARLRQRYKPAAREIKLFFTAKEIVG